LIFVLFCLVTAGFAFVYFVDENDAEDAIRGVDTKPFGYDRRKLSVEWARGERGRPRDGSSRSVANQRPTKTLFMINFDANRTTARDIERHFEPYGKILHVRIRRNFAFVQFETQEDATKALKCTDMRLVTGLTMIMVFLSVCMIHQTNECSVILQQAVRQGGIS
jgi:arginine/serine-rich splicing factor 4/5/6